MSSHIVAVDAGTSMVKAVLVSSTEGIVAHSDASVERDALPGLSPAAMWSTTAAVIQSLVAGQPDVVIDGVVITGQGDGLWAIDDQGQPAPRAYLWNSTEAADTVEQWSHSGLIDAHYRQCGTVLWPGSQAALWVWLLEHRPDEAHAMHRVFCAKDFLNYCLTGVVATDPTDASIPFLDSATGTYSTEAASRLGCEALLERLAPIIESGDRVGSVTTEAALLTGVPEGTPVFQGALDVVAMVWGSGLGAPGDVLAVLGTTAASMTVTPRESAGEEPAGATIVLPGDAQLRVMGSSSGTATLEWYLGVSGYQGEDRYERFWADVALSQDGHEIFLPFIRGERAPVLAPHATGSFLGMTPETTSGRLARAVSEGITCALRWGIDSVLGQGRSGDLGTVVLAGGGSQAHAWACQVANILDRPIQVDGRNDLGARGVARVVFKKLGIAVEFEASAVSVVTPDQHSAAVRERYAMFLSAVKTLPSGPGAPAQHEEKRRKLS